MRRLAWGCFMVCALSSFLSAAKVVKIEDARALAGAEDVLVRVLVDTDEPIMGISFAGTFDTGLTLVDVSVDGTELGPDALNAESVWTVEPPEVTDYFGFGAIIDFNSPYDWRTLPAGDDQFVLALYFDVGPGVATGAELAVDLRDDLGDPVIDPVFTVGGVSKFPDLLDGTVTVVGPPDIVSVSVAWAPVAGGTPVTVQGTSFTDDADPAGVTAVTVGGSPLEGAAVVDSTTITGTLPAHAAGSVDVTVWNDLGTDTLAGAITYVDPPTIESVAPNTGTGEVDVTIAGTNFTDADDTVVRIGSTEAAIVSVSATEIVCTVPPCGELVADGSDWVTVEVETSGGIASLTEGYFCEGGSLIEFTRGDANCDGARDIADAVAVLSYLFSSGPARCRDALDTNDSGALDIADAIYLLAFLFGGGPEPPPPFPSPGVDPTDDDGLECEEACPAR